MEQIIINEKDFNKIKKKIQENKNKEIIFFSEDDELNRKVIEKLSINILLINQKDRKDFMKQRNSGFNHILAKSAKKNNIKIGINLDEIIKAQDLEKAQILARVKQNIKLCNKNKIQMIFIQRENKRDLHLIKSLGLVLGMPTWMVRDL